MKTDYAQSEFRFAPFRIVQTFSTKYFFTTLGCTRLREAVRESKINCCSITFCLTVCVWSFTSSLACLAADEKLNVLMLCVDDLKPILGCYGDGFARTPNLDRLARQGVLFRSAYCNQAVCSPSRNALMTSLRPQTLGIYELTTNFRASRPAAVTVAQHFRAHGYTTQSLGKIFHTGHGNFDDEQSWSLPSWKPKAPTYLLAESTSLPPKSNGNGPKGNATECAEADDADYGEGQLADELVSRLQQAAQNRDEPFFIAGGFIKPHLPFVAPKRYWDLYDPEKLPMPVVTTTPVGAPSYAPHTSSELRSYADMPNQGAISKADTRKLIHGYYAATSYMDAQIGRVLNTLDELKLWESTIVLLWGDHGWHLGDHGMWCKHSNYEQAVRIPFLIAAPRRAANASTEAMIETVDIFPTLCELAGLPIPNHLDGRSFAAVVENPALPARTSVTHVYPRGSRLGRAIRDARYRFVEWKNPGADESEAEFELYDYKTDPHETKNIAVEQPGIVEAMRRILREQPEAVKQIASAKPAESPAKSAAPKKKSEKKAKTS